MPDPLPTGRFNHATLNCRDARRSVEFYSRVLGFQEMKRPGFNFVGAWLYREGLGMMLHLNQVAELAPPVPDAINTRVRHLAFHVNDYDRAIELLAEHSINFEKRTLPDHGYRQVFFHDPDGNLIELGEWPDAEHLAESL